MLLEECCLKLLFLAIERKQNFRRIIFAEVYQHFVYRVRKALKHFKFEFAFFFPPLGKKIFFRIDV